MLVKTKEKEISFLFQEEDPFFEIGCQILEQEQISQMFPYKRRRQNGMEKLIFETAAGGDIVRLMDIVPALDEGDRIDLLYEMISLCKTVEENGFLKKECIWYKYDNIYYDRNKQGIMAAILPITGEFRYADSSWYDYFEEAMKQISSGLSQDKAAHVGKIVLMMRSGKFDIDGALAELGKLGCGLSTELCGQHGGCQKVRLELLYSGRDGRLEFVVDDGDFLIGRDAGTADGVIVPGLSKAVSREHCLITKMNNKYFVQDLKSVNHTLVNGTMIPPYELMELGNNDILSVADIEFRVLYRWSKNEYDKNESIM